jgi:outer membrane protein assembly factor BamB
VIWSRELVRGYPVQGLIASPAYDGTSFLVGSASPVPEMFALKPADGTTLWHWNSFQPIYSAPAVGKGVLIFGTGAVFGDLNSGLLVALAASDGHLVWGYDMPSAVRSGPALAGDLLVVGDYAGDLMAFRPKP